MSGHTPWSEIQHKRSAVEVSAVNKAGVRVAPWTSVRPWQSFPRGTVQRILMHALERFFMRSPRMVRVEVCWEDGSRHVYRRAS